MPTLTPEQEKALQALQAFVQSPDERVFVLKGPAGTGKTTLVKAVVDWLVDNQLLPVLLASTGRAAQVLAEKVGRTASTVHGLIYIFEDIVEESAPGQDAWKSEQGQLVLNFSMKQNVTGPKKRVYIVDEASMIGHEVEKQQYTAKFGTGSLLGDFIKFTAPEKVVFVGDHCQLPPVSKTPFSAALDLQFLATTYQIQGSSFELRQIMRQQADNPILELAGRYRWGIESETFEKYPKLSIRHNYSEHTVVYPTEASLVQAYVTRIQTQGLNAQVMLTNSNWKSLDMNRQIRAALGKTGVLAVGDLLMVVQNNYVVNLVNGDQVEVTAIHGREQQSGIPFLDVEVRSLANGFTFQTKLLEQFLDEEESSLPNYMAKKLLIDLDIRLRKQGISRKSDGYKDAMMNDPYFNALRAKFGYCITTHKSQGGEWPEVFLLIHKSVFGMRGATLYRWFYTALTRAREKLHLHRDWWIQEY